jgi:hypothetical protein
LLYLASFSLLVGACLLAVSALAKRPDLGLHLSDRPREVCQLTSDHRDVLLGRHFASEV